jgi:hypothetical protein
MPFYRLLRKADGF